MRDILAQVESAVGQAVTTYAMWPAGATLVVAVSGGADSLCLLGALLSLPESHHPLAPGRLIVAHLDHGLRGEAGAEDARFVAAFAAERGLECVTERADVRQLARTEHRSIEDAARRARYGFLRRVAHDTGSTHICTGHTRDDQAETLVMHWLRGSGLAGLAGMAPLSGDLARPLLDLSRAKTLAYCAGRGWQPREDATNADTTYLRNRIRHELLPILEHYNPNLRDTLIRNAALIAGDEHYLEMNTDVAWAGAMVRADTSAVALAIPALAQLTPALRRRVVRRMVSSLLVDASGLSARHIFAIERLLSAGTSGDSLALPGGLLVRREYDALICERRAPSNSKSSLALGAGGASIPAGPRAAMPAPTRNHRRPATRSLAPTGEEVGSAVVPPISLPIPGSRDLPALGWRLRASILPGPLDASTLHARSSPIVDIATGTSLPEARAYLDADIAGDTLLVRTWRRGDRIQPLGMSQEKKLQDLFTDAKIPRSLRTRLPLVCGVNHLLWMAGLRLDERARIGTTTTRVLVLDLEPLVS